jgi:hypothetical protein
LPAAENGGGAPPPREKARESVPGVAIGPGAERRNDEAPGVPGFRTWRGLYWFVFGCFVLMVILLALFSRAYA